MANPLGNRLSRLVREHAYLSGSLPGLKADVRLAESALTTKTRQLELSLQRLAEVDQQITELSGIDVSEIIAMRRTPRVGKREYGALRRTIIDVMSNGRPMRTVDLITLMAPIFEWDLSTLKGRKYASNAVCDPLYRFKARGLAERLPNVRSDTGQLCGVWRWIGSSDDNNPPAQMKTADR